MPLSFSGCLFFQVIGRMRHSHNANGNNMGPARVVKYRMFVHRVPLIRGSVLPLPTLHLITDRNVNVLRLRNIMMQIYLRLLRPLTLRNSINVVFRSKMRGPIILYLKRHEQINVRHVRRRIRFRFGIIVIKGSRHRIYGTRTVRLSHATRTTRRNDLAINGRVRLFLLFHPRMIVFHRRRRVANIWFVLAPRGLHASTFIMSIHPLIKTTRRSDFVRPIVIMTETRHFCRLVSKRGFGINGPQGLCL